MIKKISNLEILNTTSLLYGVISCFLGYYFYQTYVGTPQLSVTDNITYQYVMTAGIFSLALIFWYTHRTKRLDVLIAFLISLPWLGNSFARCILQIACLFLILSSQRRLKFSNYFSIHIIIVSLYLGSLIRSIKIDVDPDLFFDTLRFFQLKTFPTEIIHILSFAKWNIINFLEICVLSFMPLVIASIRQNSELIQDIKNGLFYTTIPIILLTFAQIYTEIPLFRLQLNEFWILQGRISAISSDPNAFGVFSGLAIMFLIAFSVPKDLLRNLGASLVVFICSTFSGSRSSFLLLFISLLLASIIFKKNFEKLAAMKRAWFMLVATIFSFVLCILYKYRPPSIDRVLYSFSLTNFSQSMESRLIYFRIAKEMFLAHPLVGVGFGRFYFENEKFASKAGVVLNNWKDNANNYYAEILCEGGILALLLLVLIFYLIHNLVEDSGVYRSQFKVLFYSFAIVLFFGPHLHFIEVKWLLVLLFSTCISNQRTKTTSPTYNLIFLLPAIYVLFQIFTPDQDAEHKNYGLHANESVNTGVHRHWTGSMGRLCIDSQKENHTLLITNNNPKDTIQIRINEAVRKISPHNTETFSFTNEIKVLNFAVDTVWRPSELLNSNDSRILGLSFSWVSESNCI